MNSKTNWLLMSLVSGLGLTLGLQGLLNKPFTRPLPVAHGADRQIYLSGCTHDPIQAAVDDANDGGVNKVATNTTATDLLPASNVRRPIPELGPCNTYAVYYGPLDEETLTNLKTFDLVILHPGSGITPSQVAELQAAGVIVLAYVSIGEEPPGTPQVGDGLGPVYYDSEESCAGVPNRHCGNQGVASYYLDEYPRDGEPDVQPTWRSYYVDPASPIWRERVKLCVTGANGCNFYGTDYVINTLEADGLFLDTVDTAAPWLWNPYSYTLDAMVDFIITISNWYFEDRYVVLNRGIYFSDPKYKADLVRPSINGIVFEGYYSGYDRIGWAMKLNAQATMTDGYTVSALDYFAPTQHISIANQISETVRGWGWLDYISTPYLDTIRWDVWEYYKQQDLACVTITGPTVAMSCTTYTFSATVKPITTTTPITYSWQVTNQSPVTPHVGGVSDTIPCTWDTIGARVITVTAQNAAGIARDTHTVDVIVVGAGTNTYLPIVLKNN